MAGAFYFWFQLDLLFQNESDETDSYEGKVGLICLFPKSEGK